jgi:hypothetical protein
MKTDKQLDYLWAHSFLDGKATQIMYTIKAHVREVAVTAQMFQSFNEHDSAINSVDRMIEMAEKFIEEYPIDTKWGIEEGLEWEETLYAFYTKHEASFRGKKTE